MIYDKRTEIPIDVHDQVKVRILLPQKQSRLSNLLQYKLVYSISNNIGKYN